MRNSNITVTSTCLPRLCFLSAAVLLSSCGKVADLSEAAGIFGASGPLTIQAVELGQISVGIPYKEIIRVEGGQAPFVMKITKGALLEGLALDSRTGIISGTVAKGDVGKTATISVQVTDSGAVAAEQSFLLKVGAYTFSLSPSTVQTITPTVAYALKINAVGAAEPVKYSLSGSLPQKLTFSSDGSLVSATAGLDSSLQDTEWPVEVTGTDANNIAASAKYTLRVGKAPSLAKLEIQTSALTPMQVGSYSSGVSTTGGVAPLAYTLESGTLPSGLSMSSTTGVISGTIPSASSGSSYAIIVKVADSSGQSATKTYSGTVSAGSSTLVLHTTTLSQFTAGLAFSYTLAVTGGSTPYTFSVASGSLPTGMTLNSSSGLISGTPTSGMAGQAYAFTVQVLDAVAQSTSKTYLGTVAASSSSSVSIVSTTIPSPTAGVSYLAAIGVTGGTSPYGFAITSGALPSGLSINASSGLISGTATYASQGTSYLFTVTVTDAGALTASQVYSGFVTTYSTTLIPSALSAATPGASYNAAFATSGGQSAYTYTITAGALPSGLSLNSSTGVISGIVAEAEAGTTKNFTIKSVDANAIQTSTAYSLTTNAFVVSVSTTTLANATEGTAYSNSSTSLGATGGTAPYTYAYSGTLPSGVGLTSSGAFFGTPSSGAGALAGGTVYTIYVRARDAANLISAQKTLTLTVVISVPVVATDTPSNATLGIAYSYSLSGSGGRPAYTYAKTSGSFPTGVTMTSAGVISGTATAATACPATQFAIQITDALGQTSAAVNKCITSISGVTLSNTSFVTVVQGVNYSATVAATGGTAPYSFTSSGLPTGVSLASSTGVLSGFTNAANGDYTVYLSVTDSSAPAVTSTRSFTFRVRDPLSITTASPLAVAGTGVSYGPVALAATGGASPYTFAISSGGLPSGLTMTTGGSISGTPSTSAAATNAGVYSITVVAADSSGLTSAGVTLSLAVYVAPKIATTSLPPALLNSAYAFDVVRIGGVNSFNGTSQATRLTWTVTGLPPGMTHNGMGRIYGTPTSNAGSPYSVVVSVQDANGFTGAKTLPLTVRSAGLTLDLKSSRFSEPCLANNTSCDPRAYAVSPITGNSQQFAIYSRNDTNPKSVQIAKIDSTGRIPVASSTVTSINVVLPANVGTITSLQIADLDQDGFKDIVFIDTTNKQVCALWNGNTVDTVGMPTGFVSTSFDCWAIPTGGHTANAPYTLLVSNSVRPDAINYGKQDMIITDAQQANNGNSIVIMLNTCVLNGACTGAAARSALFSGFTALSGSTTNASAVVTVASTAGVGVGMQIVGVGIPAATTVVSFVANTSITMSAAASATNAGVKLSLPYAYTTTGTMTTGSAVITAVASTAGVAVGMSLTSPIAGIPAGSYVLSFVANTSITISQQATATNAGVSMITFGPKLYTPMIIAQANSQMRDLFTASLGYFDAAAPNPTTTYSTSTATCPSILISGFQNTNTGNGYIHIMKQTFSGGQCQGDFVNHGANDEILVATGTPYLDGAVATDFNNDGISDIAIGISTNNQANSASLRVYLMPGGATFTGATILQPQMQSINGVIVGAAKIAPFCLNGAATCTYQSLAVMCDRQYAVGRVTGYACLSVFPNLCASSGCTNAFETGTQTSRIDYPAPWGMNREPVFAPVVSTSNTTPTGDVTSGSPTINNVSSTASVSVGQTIAGSGIPANTYVTAKAASTITMSKNGTATSTTVALTVPVVPTINDLIMMGTDTTGGGTNAPFFLTFPRNSTSTTDPFKSALMMNGFPSAFLVAVEAGQMKLTDFNNDGYPDLVANIVNQGVVSTYMAVPGGSPSYSLGTSLPPNYLSNSSYYGCPAGAASCLPDPVFNTMGTNHGYPSTVGGWHMTNTMDVMDINNDGIPDVVITGYSSRGVSVALGTTNGTLGSSVLYDVGTNGDLKPQAVLFADLDQDGKPDLVVASINVTGSQIAYISWLKGNGDGTFQAAQQINGITSTCTDPRAISAVDLDLDGRPELTILCYQTQPQGIWIARRHTDGSWVTQTGGTINPGGGNNGTIMKWGRLTSTTGMDVVVGGLDVTNSVRILAGVTATVTNSATGAFTLSVATTGSYISTYGYPSDVDIADFNSDGFPDIVVGVQTQNGHGTQSGSVFYTCQTTGAGTCTLKGWGMDGYQTTSAVAGDLNGDGKPDLLIGYRSNSTSIQRMIYRTIGRTLNSSY